METIPQIKKRLINSIDKLINETTNFITLSFLKRAKKDIKYANRQELFYIVCALNSETDIFNGYMDSINFSNYKYWLKD